MESFKALIVREENGEHVRTVEQRNVADLPEGDLLIRVHYSSLNYKDALSASGNKGVTREYPHVPGIDASGVVVKSSSEAFSEGDEIIATSYDLGMNTSGGFGEYIRVPAKWALKLPVGLTLQEAMVLGTAGLTAGMSVSHIVDNIDPQQGKIAVSGATGGVGTLSVAILVKLGYEVVAITGKSSEEDFLKSLGVSEVLSRSEFAEISKKPLLKCQFAGAIDTVGGSTLENLIKSIDHMGVVTLCGNIGGADFQANVYPFILRGLTLVGIESQNFPMERRQKIWQKLSADWKPEKLMHMFREVGLDELNCEIDQMLAGKAKGRVLVKVKKQA